MTEHERYFGKYRGTVINNVDPEMRGRILAKIPDVSTRIPLGWALPCFPLGGIQTGIIAVPPIGAGVWIEFEQGNRDFPVWTGCFFGSAGEVPAMAQMTPPGIQSITLQTTLRNGITISDMPGPSGGIQLKSASGATIVVNDAGISIQNGKGASLVMTGPTVTINSGALMIA
jgi:uncharacterized protein involved in type VI secretion and phage assembly